MGVGCEQAGGVRCGRQGSDQRAGVKTVLCAWEGWTSGSCPGAPCASRQGSKLLQDRGFPLLDFSPYAERPQAPLFHTLACKSAPALS